MMVKQCDVCGKLCTERKEDHDIPHFNRVKIYEALGNNKVAGRETMTLDLCPDCQKSLWRWKESRKG